MLQTNQDLIFLELGENNRDNTQCQSKSSKTCCLLQVFVLHRGSYMSAHVLLNLLNELGKSDKMRGLPSILLLFRNVFNKFNKTGARMLYSIYHMTLKLNNRIFA